MERSHRELKPRLDSSLCALDARSREQATQARDVKDFKERRVNTLDTLKNSCVHSALLNGANWKTRGGIEGQANVTRRRERLR